MPLVIVIYIFSNIIIKYPPSANLEGIVATLLILVFIIPSIVGLTFVIINPSRKFIFNRLEGAVTMPAYHWKWLNKDTVTVSFDKVVFYPAATGISHGTIEMSIVGKKGRFTVIEGVPNKINHYASLIWYMDKNRPLPPDKDLDPYREKDYNRRKAEGFPKPLFPSNVHTPEWKGAPKKGKRK